MSKNLQHNKPRDGAWEVKGNPLRKPGKKRKNQQNRLNPPVPAASLAKIVQCIKEIYFTEIRPQLGSYVNFSITELPK